MRHITIFVLYAVCSNVFSQMNSIEQINPYCSFNTSNNKLKCEEFFALSDLIFEASSFANKKISTFHLKPAGEIAFDDGDLNIDELLNSFDENYAVELNNFATFNFKSNPFALVKKQASKLSISNSRFDFYVNPNIDLATVCTYDSVDNYFLSLVSIFKHIQLSSDVRYLNKLCPLIFRRAKIDKLYMTGLNDDNRFEFVNLKPASNKKLASYIDSLEIDQSTIENFDSSILNKDVFEFLKEFKYTQMENDTSLFQISDPKLFQRFSYLKRIQLDLNNFELFVLSTRLEWLSNLNLSDGKTFTVTLIDQQEMYTFPDEDFCNFTNYPQNTALYTEIYTTSDLNCSCTLVWILKNTAFFSKLFPNLNFDNEYEKCNFKQKLRDCLPTTTTTTKTTPQSTSNTRLNSTSTKPDVDDSNKNKSNVDVMLIIFSSMGAIGIILVVVMIIYYVRKKQLKNMQRSSSELSDINSI
jgi:hypothetical protein